MESAGLELGRTLLLRTHRLARPAFNMQLIYQDRLHKVFANVGWIPLRTCSVASLSTTKIQHLGIYTTTILVLFMELWHRHIILSNCYYILGIYLYWASVPKTRQLLFWRHGGNIKCREWDLEWQPDDEYISQFQFLSPGSDAIHFIGRRESIGADQMFRDDLHVRIEYHWEQSNRGSDTEDGASPDQHEHDGGSSGRRRPLGRPSGGLLHNLESFVVVQEQPVPFPGPLDSRHAYSTVDHLCV